MPQAVKTAFRQELRRAGLPGEGALAHLLEMLRESQDTHLGLADVVRMATETGSVATPLELARQLETLADFGLLGRLPSTAGEPVFDTVTEPHSHLVYEEPAQIVDLDVSPETLLAILRQALAERPNGVEVLVRFRREPPKEIPGAASRAATDTAGARKGRLAADRDRDIPLTTGRKRNKQPARSPAESRTRRRQTARPDPTSARATILAGPE